MCLTFAQWQVKCASYARGKLGFSILDDDDPYVLFEAMPPAHAKGQSPESFIDEMFADDFAAQEYDRQCILRAMGTE